MNKRAESGGRDRRVVLLGAGGFVGSAVRELLTSRGHTVFPLTRSDVDLAAEGAAGVVSALMEPEDVLVIAAAKAPTKSNGMLQANIAIQSAICEAIERARPSQVVYVSSDAVYRDSASPLTEESCAQPSSLHGVMHLSREVMLQQVCADDLCVLRPTLIYGRGDPHNGYGPNRFARSAREDGEIQLFGGGEEVRDHVLIDDVASLLVEVVEADAVGTLNVASGRAVSFHLVATLVAEAVGRPIHIRSLPRGGPMPHGGLREFDATSTRVAFPGFSYTRLEDGIQGLFV